jgi:serine/threonine protein kinase
VRATTGSIAMLLKIVSETLAHDATILARFEREAKAIAALSHPNILAIHDFSKEQEIWYAVTECLEGQTLRDKIDRGPVEWRKAVEIAIEIAAGLTAAHDRKIVHRDLKPDNIFLTHDGRVKILDFGLARPHLVTASTQAKTTSMISAPGHVLGTYGYMSPEQIRGELADARADIFSFGCLLFELIAGIRPSPEALARKSLPLF